MTIRTILLALEVEDAPNGPAHAASASDLVEGLVARLDEFFPTDDGFPFEPSDVRVAVTDSRAARALFAAADVGLDGAEDGTGGFSAEEFDAAYAALHALADDPESEDDGAPCCPDPGCGGNPCTFPGYADNH